MKVNPVGTSFNPNGYSTYFPDPYYDTVTYYTYPSQPGMIYYKLSRYNTKEPVVVKQTDKAREKNKINRCIPQKVMVNDRVAINNWESHNYIINPSQDMRVNMFGYSYEPNINRGLVEAGTTIGIGSLLLYYLIEYGWFLLL